MELAYRDKQNIDPRNVERGRCLSENCDCEEYLRIEITALCGYCNDPPTKHANLGKKTSPAPEETVVTVDRMQEPGPSTKLTKSEFESRPQDKPQEMAAATRTIAATPTTITTTTTLKQATTTIAGVLMANRPNLHNSCPWEDVSYGWIPNPIRETGKYYNHLLPEFYRTYWPICYGSVATFKSAFMLERKRQWEEKELLAKAEKQL